MTPPHKLDRERLVNKMALGIARTKIPIPGSIFQSPDDMWVAYLEEAEAALDALIAELPDFKSISEEGVLPYSFQAFDIYQQLKSMGKHD